MARFVCGALFGAACVLLGGAALSIHAAAEGGAGEETAYGTDEAETPGAQEALATPVPTPEPPYSVWDRLAICESTSNWRANTGNGYFGGVQMDLTFWRRYGGLAFAARPDLASRGEQIVVAERGLAVQGFGAWPSCSRRLGLR